MQDEIMCPYCQEQSNVGASFIAAGETPPEHEPCSACAGTGTVDKKTIVVLRMIYLVASQVAHQHQLWGGWEKVWEDIYVNLKNILDHFLAEQPNRLGLFSQVDTTDTAKAELFSDTPRQGDEQLQRFIDKNGLLKEAKQILRIQE